MGGNTPINSKIIIITGGWKRVLFSRLGAMETANDKIIYLREWPGAGGGFIQLVLHALFPFLRADRDLPALKLWQVDVIRLRLRCSFRLSLLGYVPPVGFVIRLRLRYSFRLSLLGYVPPHSFDRLRTGDK